MTASAGIATFDLSGLLAVVTGASRGIGRAMAVALASAGADIIGVSASMPHGDSGVRSDVEALGRTFTPVRCDFSDRAQVAALGESLVAGARPIDILVNNAGTISRAPAAVHSDQEW